MASLPCRTRSSQRKRRLPQWLCDSVIELNDIADDIKDKKSNNFPQKVKPSKIAKIFHHQNEETMKNFKAHLPASTHTANQDDSKWLRCQLCYRQYPNKLKYREHMRGVHGIRVGANEKQFRCPIASCHQTNSCRSKYFEHLEQVHNIEIEQITLNFHDYQEFCQWKKQEEARTKNSYFRNQRIYKNKQQRNLGHFDYYYCSKSGYYNSKDKWYWNKLITTNGSQKDNVNGSDSGNTPLKMGSLCPARIRVESIPNPPKLVVEFTRTHIGHELNQNNDNQIVQCSKKIKTIQHESITQHEFKVSPITKKIKQNRRSTSNSLSNHYQIRNSSSLSSPPLVGHSCKITKRNESSDKKKDIRQSFISNDNSESDGLKLIKKKFKEIEKLLEKESIFFHHQESSPFLKLCSNNNVESSGFYHRLEKSTLKSSPNNTDPSSISSISSSSSDRKPSSFGSGGGGSFFEKIKGLFQWPTNNKS